MTIIDLPMNIVYGVCAIGFAAATVRSVQVAIENWRRGCRCSNARDAIEDDQ